MDKRYQVFISSTFQDLQPARQEVSQALLRADCFPAGMELFPAADEEQFEFIKQVIDQSDYYIIISAGRYGSIHPATGLSYTEMEYDYAMAVEKPIIRLLHKDPFNMLTGKDLEQKDDRRQQLVAFREKLSRSHLAKFWESPDQLGVETLLALIDTKKRFESGGWVRGEDALDISEAKELIRLRKLTELQASELKQYQSGPGNDPASESSAFSELEMSVAVWKKIFADEYSERFVQFMDLMSHRKNAKEFYPAETIKLAAVKAGVPNEHSEQILRALELDLVASVHVNDSGTWVHINDSVFSIAEKLRLEQFLKLR